MAGHRCLVAAIFLFVCLTYASARKLHQHESLVASAAAAELSTQQPSSDLLAAHPVLLGGGDERIIRSQSVRQRGGAMRAIGRQSLKTLRAKAGFKGTLVDLAREIETDSDLAIDAVNKALMFTCEGLTAEATTEITSGVAPTLLDSSVSAAQAFSLSSRPTATRKIYLDFDGHITEGTDWNNNRGISSIVTPAFDKDGNPAAWSADELSDIVAIWRAVSEDYAMFDVDVTTADPGAALSGNGVRVVIGGSSYDWYGRGAGGVAYVGRFLESNTPPAYVFTKQLANNAKYIWEAVSHEVGHTLGLWHDGLKATPTSSGTAYYSGQGVWAPIMGSSYHKAVTTFDNGAYRDSNNAQDDFAVIGQFLPRLPQQFGSDAATATPLSAPADAATGTATAKASGIVASASGDWFSLNAAAGPATISVAVLAPWVSTNRANLDVLLTVYDSALAVVATLNPAGLGVPAAPVTLLASGTYYVAVTGTGAGDPAVDGYSSYASRGQYELSVVYTPYTAPVPSPSPEPELVVPSPSPVPEVASPSPVPEPVPSPSPEPEVASPSPSPEVESPSPSPEVASPSPSPVLEVSSPSPSPEVPSPSPSPSPEPEVASPSPSPVPEPSPSPSPVFLADMRVSSISMSRLWADSTRMHYYCAVTVVLRETAAPAAAVRLARVSGQWSMSPAGTTTWSAGTTTRSSSSVGTVSWRSGNISKAPGGSCTFSIKDATHAQYQLDAALSVMTRTLQW